MVPATFLLLSSACFLLTGIVIGRAKERELWKKSAGTVRFVDDAYYRVEREGWHSLSVKKRCCGVWEPSD